jgi:TfoX/Sxy family transcriptional regulator of competence genes
MAYSEALADRVRALITRDGVSERKMFGGLALLIGGNMACGVIGDKLMVRVGPEQYEAALAEPDARPMDFTGRAMKGMVYVAAKALRDDAALAMWVQRGASYAGSLPAK